MSSPITIYPMVHNPKIPDITPKTRKFLRLKALTYLLKNDRERLFLKYVPKRVLKYAKGYLKSLFKRKAYTRSGDLFFYGLKDLDALKEAWAEENALLVVGFAYCHKPFACPDGRFTKECRADPAHPVCHNCFIGEALRALPSNKTLSIVIPSVYDIGKKLFETIEAHPDKKILFLITACALSLEMFGDFAHMTGVQGVGVRLEGRICNTFKAFDLAERGIKPGLTAVPKGAQEVILELLQTKKI